MVVVLTVNHSLCSLINKRFNHKDFFIYLSKDIAKLNYARWLKWTSDTL